MCKYLAGPGYYYVFFNLHVLNSLLITALKKDNRNQLRSSFELPVLIAVQEHGDPPPPLCCVERLVELLSAQANKDFCSNMLLYAAEALAHPCLSWGARCWGAWSRICLQLRAEGWVVLFVVFPSSSLKMLVKHWWEGKLAKKRSALAHLKSKTKAQGF